MQKKAFIPFLPLFSVSNHHLEHCGNPPQIDGDAAGKYFGYFENQDGEQMVYCYDYQTQKGTLRMGDAHWEKEYVVDENGIVKEGILLSYNERLWLWLTSVTARKMSIKNKAGNPRKIRRERGNYY
jgi:hypothetical protein